MTRWKVFVAILVAILALLFMVHLNGWSLDFTDREVVIIVTDSMEGEPTDYPIDTIERNTVVMVEKIHSDEEKASLKEGDVIQFLYFGLKDHHRLISNDPANRMIVTKGDNQPFSENVSYDRILGKVVGKDHVAGMIVSFAKSNWILLIVVLLSILLIPEVYRRLYPGEKEEHR